MPELELPKRGEKYLTVDGKQVVWLCYEKSYGFVGYYRGMSDRPASQRKAGYFADWQDTSSWHRDGRNFNSYPALNILRGEPQPID